MKRVGVLNKFHSWNSLTFLLHKLCFYFRRLLVLTVFNHLFIFNVIFHLTGYVVTLQTDPQLYPYYFSRGITVILKV